MLLSPLPKGRGPSFEPIYIILTQRDFKSSLDEIGQPVLEKSFKKFSILLFDNYLPLKKGVAFHLNKLESP